MIICSKILVNNLLSELGFVARKRIPIFAKNNNTNRKIIKQVHKL